MKLMGVRHAEDGRLYAILSDPDPDKEEPVDVFPFAEVQVGPDCKFGRRISAVALEYGPTAKWTGCFNDNYPEPRKTKGEKEHDRDEVHAGAVGCPG